MNEPLVSIVTPCYNGEEFLDKYFSAILAQTYQNLELIFINDGSTDRTEEIALSYSEALADRGIVYKYCAQPNGGQANAMNRGLKLVTGEYLVWPDSDDLLAPESIAHRVRFLQNNPQYAMVRSDADAFDYNTGEQLFHFARENDKQNKDIFLDLILEQTYCCCGCYMIQVSALREIYPDMTIMENSQGQNWQLLIPMAGRHHCGFVDEVLYHCAMRPNSHSRAERSIEQERLRRMGLRAILEDGIRRSGRTDRDYERLVEIKYQRIMLHVYAAGGDAENTEMCYQALKAAGEVQERDYAVYTKLCKPFLYRLHTLKKSLVGFAHRAKGRIFRKR